jgi:release factor glutamine methyltransferase
VSAETRRLVAESATRLATAGVDSPVHDAETLVAFVLGTTRAALHRRSEPLDVDACAAVARLVERRARREPLQHLTGTTGFRYLDLTVGPGVFVPRPETEALAGAAVEELSRLVRFGTASPVAVDLCTGSGAVAAAMASEVPGSRVTAVELSEPAYAYAVRNAGPLGVDVRLADMADGVRDLEGTVHVVTANPPYIPLDAFESVAVEARDFDPPISLWSGPDGLDAIRVVAAVAARLLVPGGLVLCEHADVQHLTAPEVFARSGRWRAVRDNEDLAGRPRFVTARRVDQPAA